MCACEFCEGVNVGWEGIKALVNCECCFDRLNKVKAKEKMTTKKFIMYKFSKIALQVISEITDQER